jgi:tetratricopeptide (TPR) repeat protein
MNYLSSVGPNGIVFTNGDNDTYPLWYVQETEGFRTDVRVTNLSFLQTEWYVDQLLRPAYESEPLPIKWSQPAYYGEMGSAAFVLTKEEIENVLRQNNIPPVSFGSYYDINAFKDTLSLKQTMENLRTGQNSKPNNPFSTGDTQIIPGNVLVLDVDSANVDWEALHARPGNKMHINLKDKSAVYRQELMILEMLSNINDENWQRSIHFATTITPGLYMNLQESNFSLNGLTYQVVPGTPLSNGVNTEAAYDNMMNKFRWGGLEEDPDIYLDETSRRMISTFRLYFTHLVNALLEEGENEKALAAIDKANTMMPSSAVPYGTDGLLFARAYYRLGETEKAEAIISEISDRINGNLDWFARLKPMQISSTLSDVVYNNINPMLLVTTIYQQYDKERYNVMVDDLLQRAQFFYTQGISYVGDLILKEITDTSVRGFYSISPEDTLARTSEEETMQKALQMMQKYSPRLLEQYSTSTE